MKTFLFDDELFEAKQNNLPCEIGKANRDILGKFLWLSARYEKPV